MTWEILISPECAKWLADLPLAAARAITVDLDVLAELGPQLGRPQVDRLKGSRFPHMKELRTTTAVAVYRTLFAFDPQRKAILLIGGDKSGVSQQRFYKQLISRADTLYDRHLASLSDKKSLKDKS